MMRSLLGLATVATIAACGPKLAISEHRMIAAPPREPNCALQLMQVDITSFTFNSTWDVLGYVTLFDRGSQDPMAEENRALVRERACKMGGTVIALGIGGTGTSYGLFTHTGSGISYMVLRPKAAPATPTAF